VDSTTLPLMFTLAKYVPVDLLQRKLFDSELKDERKGRNMKALTCYIRIEITRFEVIQLNLVVVISSAHVSSQLVI